MCSPMFSITFFWGAFHINFQFMNKPANEGSTVPQQKRSFPEYFTTKR